MPITLKEVEKAVKDKRFQPKPFYSEKRISRIWHIERVAFLAEHGWTGALDIDVGVPSMGCFPTWPILDGNHRHAAAIFRGDLEIEVSVGGDIDYAADLFNVPAESLLLEECHPPG